MSSRNLVYVVVLVAGVALGAIARGAIDDGDAGPAPQSKASQPDARVQFRRPGDGDDAAVLDMLENLANALNQETEYRQDLEEQILELQQRVDALQASVRAPAGPNQADTIRARQRSSRASEGLTLERLVEAGLDEREASAIKARVDDLAMRRLYLRDEAMRDGWLGSQRFREESRNLTVEQDNLRAEFGDDAYDRYLFASGRSNRVSVQSVIGESPAYNAGLQHGDRILSYNGQRTHSPGDLRRATQSGTAGEMVALQVVRNGRTIDLYVPRGPLGVQMRGVSEKP